ncbi:MAG: hypothetical protein ACE5L6_02160 [Candidatus Bathyarchaeia archaeon]
MAVRWSRDWPYLLFGGVVGGIGLAALVKAVNTSRIRRELNNSLDVLYPYITHPHDMAMYTFGKGLLRLPIDRSAVIGYLDATQDQDGGWPEYWTRMMAVHRILVGYKMLAARPARSMDPFFRDYDSFEDILRYIEGQTHSDARDFYHPLLAWMLYYHSYPPWIDDAFTYIEQDLSWTDTDDIHKTSHIIYTYVLGRRRLPNPYSIADRCLKRQDPSGGWFIGTSPIDHLYYAEVCTLELLQIHGLHPEVRPVEIANAVNKTGRWIASRYRTTIYQGRSCGYFDVDGPSATPPAGLWHLFLGINTSVLTCSLPGMADPMWNLVVQQLTH